MSRGKAWHKNRLDILRRLGKVPNQKELDRHEIVAAWRGLLAEHIASCNDRGVWQALSAATGLSADSLSMDRKRVGLPRICPQRASYGRTKSRLPKDFKKWDRRKCRKNMVECAEYNDCLEHGPRCQDGTRYMRGRYATADKYLYVNAGVDPGFYRGER